MQYSCITRTRDFSISSYFSSKTVSSKTVTHSVMYLKLYSCSAEENDNEIGGEGGGERLGSPNFDPISYQNM